MQARSRNAARLVLASIALTALAANACFFGVGSPASTPTPSPAPPTATVNPTLPGRTAVLSDLVGDVQSRAAGSGKDLPASNGQTLTQGSQVRTGRGSKAKVSLSDGTILRLRPDTFISLDRLLGDPNNPFTRLLLAVGKVFVILKSGQLEVQSAVGLATVTGSFLSVEYLADTNSVVVTCLEGSCTLRNDQGGTALTTGQAASLSGGAGAAPVLRWMTADEIKTWLDDNPEAQAAVPLALTALPTTTSTQTATPTASATATNTATATRKPRPTATFTIPPTSTSTNTIPPRATPTATPNPTSTPTQTNAGRPPLNYAFQSLCTAGNAQGPGTYHVAINGPGQAKFDVPPQQSVSGQLPPGPYVISWQPDNGQPQEMIWSSDQGKFSYTFCSPT